MRRPIAPGFLVKPEPHRRKMQPEPDREALWFFEWAEPLGLSVWSGGAGWWNWERAFVRWAERNGFGSTWPSHTDLETVPELLDGYRLFVCAGHDEYWSWGMRDALDTHTGGGGNAAELERQHLLLAGALRPRRRHHDVLQVRGGRRPGARDARRAVPDGPLVAPSRGSPRDLDDRADVHARRLLAVRARRATRFRRLHGSPSGALALEDTDLQPATRSARRHDRRLRGRRMRHDARRRRPPRPHPHRWRAADARDPGDGPRPALGTTGSAVALRARARRARAHRARAVGRFWREMSKRSRTTTRCSASGPRPPAARSSMQA